jgi:putative FmdB family regulatory protein
MPIYEYRCPDGHTFEVFQRMSDAPAEACAVCGRGPVEKILFPVAVHFKGSGFYSTDYGSKKRQDGKDGKEGGQDGDGKPAEKTEKKEPAAKGDGGSSEKKAAAAD